MSATPLLLCIGSIIAQKKTIFNPKLCRFTEYFGLDSWSECPIDKKGAWVQTRHLLYDMKYEVHKALPGKLNQVHCQGDLRGGKRRGKKKASAWGDRNRKSGQFAGNL